MSIKRLVRKMLGQTPDHSLVHTAWFNSKKYELRRSIYDGSLTWFDLHEQQNVGPTYRDDTMAVARFGEWMPIRMDNEITRNEILND